MKVTIEGIGLAAPFGGKTELKTALSTQPEPLDSYATDTTPLSTYVPARKLRRIDYFTRMSLLAAYRALEDAGKLEVLPENFGIVLATGYGPSQTTFDFLDSIIDDGAHLASPLAFSHSVHNIPTGVLSLQLGTPCPQTTICQLGQPVATGLRTAALWLAEKRVDTVLFGAVDETTPLLKENMGRLRQEGYADSSLPTGDGATFFLLSTSEEGIARVDMDTAVPSTDIVFGNDGVSMKSLWGEIPIGAAFKLAAAALSVERTNERVSCWDGRALIHVCGTDHE